MANKIEFRIVGSENVSRAFAGATRALKLTSIAVGAATVATVAGAVRLNQYVNGFATAEDEVGKFALRLGTTADVLSKFHGAATFGGTSVANMNLSIQRFNRRIGDSINGMGEATKRFQALGLDAKVLAELPLDERMYALADALQAVENPTLRLSAAVGLLDSEGAGFLQTIKNGSQSLKDVARDMEYLGGVVTPQAAANAAVYKDEMARLNLALSGVGRAFSDVLMPALSGVSKQMTEFVAANRVKITAFFTDMLKNTVTVFLAMRDAFSGLRKMITGTFDWGKLLTDTISKFFQFMDQIVLIGVTRLKQLGRYFVTGFELIWQSFLDIGRWAWGNLQELFYKGDFSGLDALKHALIGTFEREVNGLKMDLADLNIVIADAGAAALGSLIDPLVLGFEKLRSEVDATMAKFSLFGTPDVEQPGTVPPPPVGDALAGGAKDDPLENKREQYKTFYDAISGYAEQFHTRFANASAQLGAETFGMLMNVANGAGQAFAQVVTGAQTMSAALSNFFSQVLSQGLAMLVRVGLQRLILSAISKTATLSESVATISAGLKAVYLNSFASAAAIPVIGFEIAPIAAQVNLGLAAAGVTQAGGLGTALAGVAHGGLDNVPQEATYLLTRGERVLSPKQNTDLTTFLNFFKQLPAFPAVSVHVTQAAAPTFLDFFKQMPAFHAGVDYVPRTGAAQLLMGERVLSRPQNQDLSRHLNRSPLGGDNINITINKIEVLPNATSARALLDMSPKDLERVISDKFIKAFDNLARRGIKMQGVY